MEAVKDTLKSVKQATQGAMTGEQFEEEPPPAGTAHKTAAAAPQTGTGVVGSLQEAGHRMQEQQGADNPGYYEATAKLGDALERGKDKLSGRN